MPARCSTAWSCRSPPTSRATCSKHTLAEAGAARLVAVVDRLAGGPIQETPQDEARVTYAAKITRADSPLDWRAPAQVVHDRIRGLHPWPHASASIGGTRLILHRSTLPGSPIGSRARHDRRRGRRGRGRGGG